jgi:hypothetical protein
VIVGGVIITNGNRQLMTIGMVWLHKFVVVERINPQVMIPIA